MSFSPHIKRKLVKEKIFEFLSYTDHTSSSPKSTCKYIMHVKSTECDEDGNLKTHLTNSLVCLTTIYKCSYIDVNILVIIQTNTYC